MAAQCDLGSKMLDLVQKQIYVNTVPFIAVIRPTCDVTYRGFFFLILSHILKYRYKTAYNYVFFERVNLLAIHFGID